MSVIQINLKIVGLGIIFYSPYAVKSIREGEPYLMRHYNEPQDVLEHIYKGSIVGFCTGSPGKYVLNIFQNEKPKIEKLNPDYAIKLCIKVEDGEIFFRDLYALLRWSEECSDDCKVKMENGNYEVIVCSWLPQSGKRGDNQQINIYFIAKSELPLISDYTREAEKPFAATFTSVFVYSVVSIFMYMIGMGAAIFTGEYDIAQIMLKTGLGVVGLLIIVFSTVTTTFLDAYSAGVSCVSISSKIQEKWAAIIVTVIGTIAAIVYPMDNITNFLYLIGSVFAPMIAVQIADYFILKKADSEKNAFQWRNLIVWLAGFIIYRMLMHVDTPLGNTLPDMVITVVLCLIVEKVAEAMRK